MSDRRRPDFGLARTPLQAILWPMSNEWDRRYAGERFFYGTAPNVQVAAALADLPPGRGLYLAEGEGRNAVHAAVSGHDVVAVDSSRVARDKALAFAAERGVALTYHLVDAADPVWEDAAPYDHAVLCFFHAPAAVRRPLHARVAAALRPGGTLILVSFAKEQLGRGTGGPPSLELLHDLAEIRTEFPGVVWTRAEALEVALDEGPGHRGPAAINALIGTRV